MIKCKECDFYREVGCHRHAPRPKIMVDVETDMIYVTLWPFTQENDIIGAIALGRNAQASDGEFVLNVELDEEPGKYTTLRTKITKEEYCVMAQVLARAVREHK